MHFLFTVSQPKLKRICQDSSPKTNHEDVHKSQTYQQFVRNMDNEIKHLQETEHFYNNGESTAHFVHSITMQLQKTVFLL